MLPDPPTQWNRHAWWIFTGWLLTGAVVILSLVSLEQPVDLAGADKFEHVLAYATLMYWWGMLRPAIRGRWMLALCLLGLALELAQGLNPDRVTDWRDVLANVLGVGTGALLAVSPAGRLLRWVDDKLPDSADSRLP